MPTAAFNVTRVSSMINRAILRVMNTSKCDQPTAAAAVAGVLGFVSYQSMLNDLYSTSRRRFWLTLSHEDIVARLQCTKWLRRETLA
jgi:hypothetical protein